MSSDALWSLLFGVGLPGVTSLVAIKLLKNIRLPDGMASLAGGLFAGVALGIVAPELWSAAGWWGALLPLATGFGFVWLVDAILHPVCGHCLGGEAGAWEWAPLWATLALHALLDGALLAMAGPTDIVGFLLLAHRIPEAVGAVALLRTVQTSDKFIPLQALGLQAAMTAGFLWGGALDHLLLHQGYGFAGGAVLFFGLHRLHATWQQANLRWDYTAAGALAAGLAGWLLKG